MVDMRFLEGDGAAAILTLAAIPVVDATSEGVTGSADGFAGLAGAARVELAGEGQRVDS